jgi:hypothetical protein
MGQLIQSATLYCAEGVEGHVSAEWLDATVNLLKSHRLCIREYVIPDNPVCKGGTHAFRESDPQLYAAVKTEKLRSVELYCHPRKQHNLLWEWNGAAILSLTHSNAYLGLPASCRTPLDELLRQLYSLAKPITSWPYGIGYFRSSELAPSLYAVGVGGGPGQPDPTDTNRDRLRRGLWLNELICQFRHLHGHFRDIYPANLLSAEHVNARLGKKTLLTAGWGTFTPLDEGHWLWTVPEEDIRPAREALVQAGLLICP